MARKQALGGKGLSALIPVPGVPADYVPETSPGKNRDTVQEVDLDLLHPNRDQPRGEIEDGKLEELARSIQSHGVIQPILVSSQEDGTFEIVAGERRWRAAQRAGLMRVPVTVRSVTDVNRLELALIENIQRQDLNPIEEATAYKRLADEFDLTQEEIAHSVGKDRATVANYRRLLNLPKEVRAEISAGNLTMGHGRAISGLSDPQAQRNVASKVRAQGLSVRETEALVKKAGEPEPVTKTPVGNDVHTRAAEDHLKIALGTSVRILRRGKKGRIEIRFTSEVELQRLYELLAKTQGQSTNSPAFGE